MKHPLSEAEMNHRGDWQVWPIIFLLKTFFVDSQTGGILTINSFSYCRAHDDRVYLEQYSVLRELSTRDEVECA